MNHRSLFAAPLITMTLAGFAIQAQAALVVSASPTANVMCSHRICTATAADAVLNAKWLQTRLANTHWKLVSGTLANDIQIERPLAWVSASQLTLDAARSITIDQPIAVTGSGALKLITNDGGTGGTLSFGKKGHVNFWNLASSLTINGGVYTLVNNIASLASDIAASPSGDYALAGSYDATPDGTYPSSPISTTFTGKFEGLGNTISNLAIHQTSGPGITFHLVGLFSWVQAKGVIKNVGLTKVVIWGGRRANIGALTGSNWGLIESSFAEGRVTGGHYSEVGGLVGGNSGGIFSSYSVGTVNGAADSFVGGLVGSSSGSPTTRIFNSHSTAQATGGNGSHVGGLIGASGNAIIQSWATGAVTVGDADGSGPPASAGGLLGYNFADGPIHVYTKIANSYARGTVVGGQNALVGGLIGISRGNFPGIIESSYSDGSVTAGPGSSIGGLIGYVDKAGVTDTYWDTTTSGISDLSRGAGNASNYTGITGLTTVQLQSGLPTGFRNTIWGQNPAINGGLPYLLSNPPT